MANDAPFYVSDIKKDPLDVFVEQTQWHTPTDPEFETAFGQEVQSERTEEWVIHIDNSPFADHTSSKAYDLVVEKDETHLVMKKVMVTWGSLYADRFRVWVRFDTVTPDPRSNFTVT